MTGQPEALAALLAALCPVGPRMLQPGLGLTWGDDLGSRSGEPVSGFEPLTCRLQDGCSAN